MLNCMRLFFGVILISFITPTLGVPLSPSVKDIASRFSVDNQRAFYLFADSHSQKIVWYIPKIASIQKSGGLPNFNVDTKLFTEGPFNGMESVAFNGAFSTIIENQRLTQLNVEASTKGYILRPANVIGAHTRVMLAGFMLDNQSELNVQCVEENYNSPWGAVVIPICRAQTLEGTWLPIDFISEFNSTLASAGSIDQTLPFSGETLPGWEYTINDLLQSGSSWDGLIQMAIEWDLPTYRTQQDARYDINWRALINYVRTNAKNNYRWRLSLSQVNSILTQAVDERRGISIRYYSSAGSSQSSAYSELQKKRVTSRIVHKLRKLLFTTIGRRNLPFYERVKVLDVPKDIYLPPRIELEQRWGSNVIAQADQLESRYDRLRASAVACEGPILMFQRNPCYEEIPEPIITPPIYHREYYVLKSHYRMLIRNSISSYNLYNTDIEQVSATTLLGIDCIHGSIGENLHFVNDSSCQ